MGRPMVVALTLHAILFASAVAGPYILSRSPGENWGGTDIGGDAISANLVSNIPLPRQQGTNVLANESKGVTVSQPKVEEKVPDAVPIPDKTTKIKPSNSKTTTNLKPPAEKIPEVAANSIPYGQG